MLHHGHACTLSVMLSLKPRRFASTLRSERRKMCRLNRRFWGGRAEGMVSGFRSLFRWEGYDAVLPRSIAVEHLYLR